MIDSNIRQIAERIKVEPASLQAVIDVEAQNRYTWGGGKIPILYERHKAFKYFAKKAGYALAVDRMTTHPNLINLASGGYSGYGGDQYKRLAAAIKLLGAEVAHLATSFGAFQIMGFNHNLAGYPTAVAMSDAFHADPVTAQTNGFINFITHPDNAVMLAALHRRDFDTFARWYNGRGYKQNRYAYKMRTARETYLS